MLIIAALGRLALSSSYTVSACVRKDNIQIYITEEDRGMEGAGEIGKEETVKSRWLKKKWSLIK